MRQFAKKKNFQKATHTVKVDINFLSVYMLFPIKAGKKMFLIGNTHYSPFEDKL